ncbi:DUF3413 domain-containing protein [Thalassomonas viridans]|uniref:DUF3413 domain-containing protein n=1 Tax=Thalassomonas viridans TaxID=137584 RepID=A0AAF0CBS6_9GAMM|nr:DUF3413 domain-containing protein [Thalassomonas viridans]WDE07978.1 DUF3413 domain-containing protein [Thalassomonas viridans]
MLSFDRKTYSKRLLQLISWSHWFTFFNIAIAIALSSFYLFSESSPETLLGQIYLVTTWLSHMAFLTFISFVLIVFPLTLLFPYTRFIRTSASLIFTLGLLLLILDAFIYTRLGYHLNASSSDQILALISNQIQQDPRSFWFISIVLCLVILAAELVISNYAWKHLKQLQKTVFARPIVLGLVASFFFSHITHIWADTELNYDILRQDTVLPLSYPTTAKTLLTKYGMFDQQDYVARKTSPLSFSGAVPQYPTLAGQCTVNEQPKRSTFVVLTRDMLSDKQSRQFAQRAQSPAIKLQHHIDNALGGDAWFNLLYSLPSIYQKEIITQGLEPVLFQKLKQLNLASSFTLIGDSKTVQNQAGQNQIGQTGALWLENLFKEHKKLNDISSLIFAEKLNNLEPGLHLLYFSDQDQYQFELFMDALLLAQRQKEIRDIIWVSSIGNIDKDTGLSIKPALLLWPQGRASNISSLTSQMDLQPTLLKNWLGCDMQAGLYSNGSDLLTLDKNRVIANTTDDGIMVFNKDKSVFIDQNGNFQSYSRQLQAPITVSSDFPLMIDGVHFIKQFSQINEQSQ